MASVLVTGPALEPITLDEAKRHCRVDYSDEDDLMSGLIVAARQCIENELRRAFITQTRQTVLSGFPAWEICLDCPPLQSVEAITYTDPAGVEQTLATSKYAVDTLDQPGMVYPEFGLVWPPVQAVANSVTIDYTVGYGDTAADVPQCVRQAILLYVAHLYENREPVNIGNIVNMLPLGIRYLLAPEAMGTYP